MAIDVTDATFQDEVLEKSMTTPVVVDLWATWCGPCNFLKPRLLQVGEEFDEKVKFVFMDIDKFPEIAEMLEIQHIEEGVKLSVVPNVFFTIIVIT